MSLKVELIPGKELSDELVSTWSKIQRETPELDSPYFRPEFTQAVAKVRSDVEVAVLSEEHAIVGFFPFQRTNLNLGLPVGGKMSDFQAIIARSSQQIDVAELVRRCKLSTWQFDHLLTSSDSFAAFQQSVDPSPFMDLSAGYEAYCLNRRAAGSKIIRDTEKRARKLEREVGQLRFEMHSPSSTALNQLREWKSEQYHRTDVLDLFQFDWVVQLLDHIRHTQSEDFSGMMSTLFAGDQLLAVHLGMRTRDVYHCWFTTYNRSFGNYSPGRIIRVRLAEAAAKTGIRRMDLGKGPEDYKYRLATGASQVATGAVDCNLGLRTARSLYRGLKQVVRNSPLAAVAKKPAWLLYKARQRYLFR